MPRPAARRPAPIVLPNHPMDTLWEVDESSDDLTLARQSTYAPSSRSRAPSSWSMASPPRVRLRSVFEDDDDEGDLRNVAFPLPPVSLPPLPVQRLFSVPRMTLPIHPAPRTVSAPSSPSRRVVSAPLRKSSLSPKHPSLAPRSVSAPFPRDRSVSPLPTPSPVTPPRRRVESQRSVSPTSSASSSDNELPRTPPATTASLPIPAPVCKPYVLAPPPPAEWESAIDALFADYYGDDEEDVISVPPSPVSSTPPMPTRRPPPPPRSNDESSYLSFSPISDSHAPLSPSLLPMSPTFARALGSPGFMPTSPGNSDSEHTFFSSIVLPRSSASGVPTRPARRRATMSERTTIPVEFLFQTA